MAGGDCTGVGTCCSGLSCMSGGVCGCLAEGATCSGDAGVCCSGLSCDGTGHCRAPCGTSAGACEPFGASCSDAGSCCSSSRCSGGECTDPGSLLACANEGGSCTTSADCCGSVSLGTRLDCIAGRCHLGQPGEPCTASTRHCTPGAVCIFPDAGAPDSGVSDGGFVDAGEVDAGEVDAGDVDAGLTDAGEVDAGPPPEPTGVCTVPRTAATCVLGTGTCVTGDSCNPSSTQNQGYDPCYYRVSGNTLYVRANPLVCSGGVCSLPGDGSPCTGACRQTPGDPRSIACRTNFAGQRRCMPSCTTDADCRGTTIQDPNVTNAQPLTSYCVNYNGSGAACQPRLCFIEGQAPYDNPALLYASCSGVGNSVCLPRYVGNLSSILGFCTAVRPGTASTLGETCNPRAGREATTGLCGRGTTCLGGRCAKVCDAAALGLQGTPTCGPDLTCISPQGLDLISSYQFGGCADPCEPFTDLASSGCVNYCGGPPARCNWIIGDPTPSEPKGYCGAALVNPIDVGQPCTRKSIDPCVAGAACLLNTGTNTSSCVRLCDPTGASGSACPTGQSCSAFTSFNRAGYCR